MSELLAFTDFDIPQWLQRGPKFLIAHDYIHTLTAKFSLMWPTRLQKNATWHLISVGHKN